MAASAMPSLPFTLRQLEVFQAVSEERSFRMAAESLGISQASVSNQLKELEAQLGLPLLSRRPGKPPTLTREGYSFLEDLRAFRVAAEKLASHRRAQPGEGRASRFRMLVGQGLMDRYVRPRLDDFLYQNPHIECEFVTQLPHAGRPLKELEDGRFDCALFHVPERIEIEEPLRILARIAGGIYGHRKFAEGSELPLKPCQLSKLPFILPPAGSYPERATLAAFAEQQISPTRVVSRTQYFDVMASMLERGLAVSSLTGFMISPHARKDVVLLYPLADWLLVSYCRPDREDETLRKLNAFVTDAVLNDTNYPRIYPAAQPSGAR